MHSIVKEIFNSLKGEDMVAMYGFNEVLFEHFPL